MSVGSKIVRGCSGLLGGAFVGLVVSVFVNIILTEVSTNAAFSILVGFLLLFMGALILYRVYVMSQSAAESEKGSKTLVVVFACLVIFSGVCCFLLDINWFLFGFWAKIPMYILLGMSLWFALSFLIIDLFNYLAGAVAIRLKRGGVRPIVSSPGQIFATLMVAVSLGAYFGVMFASFNVAEVVAKLPKDNLFTIPVGTTVCAGFGLVNQLYLQPSPPVEYFKGENFDDGI
uniref:Uncharacterized protein n=1 Tax=Aplanochytrium stocchinoi TaxID=215587 RepID=A0A6S8FUZ3_9STRA|mmetsp:Transcript_17394/g.21415  ORF Transcript_17394/g.21415 Transcript_17394/m.21415 type:complete len:231 (-) Transcript_17394:1062-1754(-)